MIYNSNYTSLTKSYRPDIDGLRAFAILAVVLFHAFPEKITGGFIGVDVFFVISGYLITNIIILNLELEKFSLVDFYVRRIKRIFPALIFVLSSCLAIGYFMLFDDEYAQLGKHIAGATSFVENIILYREGGYFEAASVTKPILHLWSLAIEEQFYIFWPILLLFVFRHRSIFLTFLVLAVFISFFFNIYLVTKNSSASFYFPFSRFWELMSGGVLAHFIIYKPFLINGYQNIRSFLGFLCLVSGIFFLESSFAFPGWWALIPVFSTLLIISAGPTSWINNKVLGNKFIVQIGLLSYPIYLWHWPLLSFYSISSVENSQSVKICILFFTILLSFFTYKYIEKPFRFGANSKFKIPLLSGFMFLVFILSMFVFGLDGLKSFNRLNDKQENFLSYFENQPPSWHYFQKTGIPEKFRLDCDFYDIDQFKTNSATQVPRLNINENCFTRDFRYKHSVLIWGDSHAQALYYGINKNIPDDWQVLIVASSGCAANPNQLDTSFTNYCKKSNFFTLQTIAKAKPDVVVVAQNKGHSIEGMEAIIHRLRQLGIKKILFIGPSPHWTSELPKLMVRNFWSIPYDRSWAGVDQKIIELDKQIGLGFNYQVDVSYISLINYLCNDLGCLIYLGKDRKLGITSWDYGHLTPVVSDFVARGLIVDRIVSIP